MTISALDAHPYPLYNARFRLIVPLLDADGDPISPSSPDTELSQDLGTFADATNEATEIATSSGIVYVDLTAAEMDTKSTVVRVQSTGAKTTVAVLNPRRLPVVRASTAQAGAASTITLDASASAVDDFYNGCWINCTNNSPSNVQGQARMITDYVGSTKVATIEGTWGTNPSSATTFEVLVSEWSLFKMADLYSILGTAVSTPATAGILDVNVKNIDNDAASASGAVTFPGTIASTTNITAGTITTVTTTATATNVTTVNGLAAGVITAASIATGAIDADAIAADAIGASELAADAVTEIQSGLATAAALTTVDDFLDTEIADIQARLPAALTAGGNMKSDALAFSGDTIAADNAEAFFDGTGYAGTNNVIPTVTTVNGLAANTVNASAVAADAVTEIQSGLATAAALDAVDNFIDTEIAAIIATLGTPAGASVSADLLTIDNLVDDLESRIGTPSNLGGGATVAANLADIEGQTDDIGAAGAGLTAVVWNAAWDAEVQSEVDDALVAQNLDHLVKIAVDTDFATTVHLNSVIGNLADNGTSATFDRTTDSLEASQAEHDVTQTAVNTVDDLLDTEVTGLQTDLDDIQARLPAALVSGRMDASVGAMAANTLTASAVAADAVSEIQSGLSTLSTAQVNAEVVDALTVDLLADSVATDGTRPTIAQALYEMIQFLTEKSVSGTTVTVKKVDGSTSLMTFTMDSATDPTSITRAT